MIVDKKIYNFVNNLNWYIDQSVITDFGDIDPKDFRPEDATYTLAIQSRMDLFVYATKFILALAFGIFFVRLQYGYLGGFKKKVIRLRYRNVNKVRILRIASLTCLLVFGVLFLTASIWSNIIDYEHIVKFAKKSSREVLNRVQFMTHTIFDINNSMLPNYFSEKELYWPYFNLSDMFQKQKYHAPGSDDTLLLSTYQNGAESLTTQFQTFLRWYTVIAIIWWSVSLILVYVHRTLYQKRMVAVSLFIAVIYIL